MAIYYYSIMTIFKQKNFSSPATKSLYIAKQAANKIGSKVKGVPEKTKTRVLRETIKLKNDLVRAQYYPGEVVNKGIEFAVTKPAAAATVGTWMSTIPFVPGTTSASIAVESAARKIPAYRKTTEKLGNAWRNSKASKKINKVTAEDISKVVRSIPILH